MKTIKLEIGRILRGETKERSDMWHRLAEEALVATNVFWQTWESWHHANGTPQEIKRSIEAAKIWHEGGKQGDKPTWPSPMPKPLSDSLYRSVANCATRALGKSVDTLRNKLNGLVVRRKSSRGSLPGWMSILLYREGRPSSTHPQPIIVPNKYLTIIPPAEKDGEWQVRFTVERHREKRGDSFDEVALWTKGRKFRSAQKILSRIASGECKHHGGTLNFDRRKGKWFLNIQWSWLTEPAKRELDNRATAFLRPAKKRPWSLRIGDRTSWTVAGFGANVPAVRRKLVTQRWERQANYRNAGSSNKGHGRRRAIEPIAKLSDRWKNFAKLLNNNVTTDVVRQCVANRCGRLVYFQPIEARRESRYLFAAGKLDKHEATGWDWFQVAAMLAAKCKDAGIEFVVIRSCRGSAGEKVDEKTKPKKGAKRKSSKVCAG